MKGFITLSCPEDNIAVKLEKITMGNCGAKLLWEIAGPNYYGKCSSFGQLAEKRGRIGPSKAVCEKFPFMGIGFTSFGQMAEKRSRIGPSKAVR